MKNPLKITTKDEQGSIKLLLKIALPLIITTSSQSIMQFADRMFLAWYSPDALAACLPAGLMSFALISFLWELAVIQACLWQLIMGKNAMLV